MKPYSLSLTICFLCFMLSACALPLEPPNAEGAPAIEPIHTTGLSPTSTKTPALTPTSTSIPASTLVPAPTSTPTAVFAWQGFAAPTEDSEIEIPGPVEPLSLSPSAINIILLGSDRRPQWGYYHTDALMIASLDPEAGTATFISIPRDLYVYIPGWKMNRINTADYRGGFEMVSSTVLYNLGIPLHHWVRIEFQGFREAIDVLGGIEIRPSYPLKDMCEGVPYEYQPGIAYRMDGFDAMCYARMRMQSTDFDRMRRQQEVVMAIFQKAISVKGLLKVPELYSTFAGMMETDMKLEQVLPLVPLATKLTLDRSSIRFHRIDSSMVENWRTPQNGYFVMLPKQEFIQAMIKEALGVQ